MKSLKSWDGGGMGVVYKAQDTKLKRTVALKFLSPELTRDSEAKERFIHEAQTASVLDHPNICTVHEIDEDGGQMFISMAYIEGESLRDKVKAGPMKLKDALNIAVQVTEGLNEAHEKGIVHRDIKSANIMVTAKGQAKIMDFGVAKLAGQTRFTRTGATMGTAAYMSPEQSRGEKVDHRTDIWSLGVVLYEMVIGQLPFRGDHEQAMMYSILNEEPEPMTGMRTGVPMELERIVNKALTKDPAARYQHTDDMLVDLKLLKDNITAFLKSPMVRASALSMPQAKPWKRALPWVMAAIMAVIAVMAVWLWMRSTSSTAKDMTRFTLAIASNQQFVSVTGTGIALSPDGTSFVYTGRGPEGRQLYVRKMDQLEAKPIPGTEGARIPFFSPDSQWVGFVTTGKIKKIALRGGPPLAISEAPQNPAGLSWSQNGTIIFGTFNSGLFQVSSSGGIPQNITKPEDEKNVHSHRWPEILPGGKAVLFTIWGGSLDRVSIGLLDLETGEEKLLLEGGSCPRYALTGHIVYGGADGSLLAVPFDLTRLEVTGSVLSLLDNIDVKSGGAANFAVSRNGTLVYLTGSALNHTIVMVDRQGNEQSLTEEIRGFRAPRISPDGKQVALGISDRESHDVWIYRLEQGPLTRLTFEGTNYYPIWTPDGGRIVFSSNRVETYDLYWKKADGSSAAEPMLPAAFDQYETAFSPDAKLLVYRETHPSTGMDIWILPLEGEREPQPFLNTSSDERTPMVSHDGRWLVYTSTESGQNEIYVRTFPDAGGGRWQVSIDGGTEPLWSRDGQELFYRSRDNKIVSVEVDTGPVFTSGARKVLFEDVYVRRYQHTNYDIHPDNQRFVMIKSSEKISTEMIVVLNWFEELRNLVPAEK
ncbi:MAG: serine/threonine-protein kinase [Candidatus Aminicenantes bacterium]|nr:MAG: serine/threonine-protein kinase [Candidatus Aminicenantes bacterium]